MQNILHRKLHGFQKAPRERFTLLLDRILDRQEFIVYEFGIAITDWDDEHHPETYGSFKAIQQEIAEILGWKSDSTASRIINRLIDKGFFERLANGRIKAKDFEQWRLRKSDPLNQDSVQNQNETAYTQKVSAHTRENRPQNNDYPLVSSKVHLSSISEELSDSELDRIGKEIDRIDSNSSFTTLQENKTIGQMNPDEQLGLVRSIFGPEVNWVEERQGK